MFNTDVKPERPATNDDASLFARCAGSGYKAGMESMLKAGIRFSHSDWVDALEHAAAYRHEEVVRYILDQLASQGSDVIPDLDWIERIRSRTPQLAEEIEACENYVRACQLRSKLALREVYAELPSRPARLTILEEAAVYPFSRDRETDIVGDNSQRRLQKMERLAERSDAARKSDGAWVPAGGEFAPIGTGQFK